MGSQSGPKVTLATRIYMPEAAAASFRLAAVSKALNESGVRVEVLTSRPHGALPKETQNKVSVCRARTLRDKTGYLRGYLQYMSFDIPLFFRLFRRRRPNAILVEPPPTTGAVVRVAAKILGVPYVYYAADVWSDASASVAPGPVVKVLRLIESFALRGAAGVIAVNDGVADRVRALGGKNVKVILNGIDTDIFTPQGPIPTPEELDECGVGQGDYLIYTGTVSEWQGADVFVEALAKLTKNKDLHLVFLSQGSEIDKLSAAAPPAIRARIHVLSLVPPPEAAKWIRGAKGALVSVKPGIGYDFAYPTKVLAALGCAVPVVFAGPGPAAADIEQYELGVACEYDPAAVAEGIEELLAKTVRKNTNETSRLASWVKENRSMSAVGKAATKLLMEVGRGGRTE